MKRLVTFAICCLCLLLVFATGNMFRSQRRGGDIVALQIHEEPTVKRQKQNCPRDHAWPRSVPELEGRLVQLEQGLIGYANDVNCEHLMSIGAPTKCTGGDRMAKEHHNYAQVYAEHLHGRPGVKSIAEIGILQGSGIALWSVLYPDAVVYGFDLSLANALANIAHVKTRGAHCSREPILQQFDQSSPERFQTKLQEFDVIIDDGLHSASATQQTFTFFEPFLANGGIYIVEDCRCEQFIAMVQTYYPQHNVTYYNTGGTRDHIITIQKLIPGG